MGVRKKDPRSGLGGKCCVVDIACEAPANGPGTVRTLCFACGQPVCKRCSTIRPWGKWGRKRICQTCDEDDRRGKEAWKKRVEELRARPKLPPPARRLVCQRCQGTGYVLPPSRIPT